MDFPRVALLIVLALGSVCFGATEPWSLLMLEIGAVGVLVLWIAISWQHLRIQVDLPTVALLLFGALAVVQGVLKVTVYEYATEQELLKIVAYFLFFFLARHLFAADAPSGLLATFFGWFGGAVAVFAIVQKLQGNGQIYWMRAATTQSFFGSYANKNHYAGLMEMMLPFAMAGAIDARVEISKRAAAVFAGSVMVASVFLSGSRTGILVILIEIALFAGLLLLRSRKGLKSYVSAALVILAAVLVIWIAGRVLIMQFAAVRDSATQASVFNRLQLTRDSFELVKQRPILGWGLGTFPSVYPRVTTWYSDFVVNAAHDDYLQLLVETGIVGFALVVSFLVLVFRAGISRILSEPAYGVPAALLGCFGLLLHSFADFNLHVPANAAIFFGLGGMICATSDLSLEKAHSGSGSR